MAKKKKSHKKKSMIVISILLLAVLVASLYWFGLREEAVFSGCKSGKTSSSPGFGIQVTTSGCVEAPFSVDDPVKYFTDGDEIVVDCSFSGSDYSGYSFVSTNNEPYFCVPYLGLVTHADGSTHWGQRQIVCSDKSSPTSYKGSANPLVGGVYVLKPTDTSLKVVCQGYAVEKKKGNLNYFGSGVIWDFTNLVHYSNVPKVVCGEESITVGNVGSVRTVNPGTLKGSFIMDSLCTGTAVIDLDESEFDILLGKSQSVGFTANGDGTCTVGLKSLSTGEVASCEILVEGFIEAEPEPPTPSPECTENEDCETGQECKDNKCETLSPVVIVGLEFNLLFVVIPVILLIAIGIVILFVWRFRK